MKILLTTLLVSLIALAGCNDEKVVNETSLPARAKQFVEAHFPDAAISQVVRDRDDLTKSYDVILDNQVKLEFDDDGECYAVEGSRNAKLPDTIIPLKVLEYVKTTYPEQFIVEWEKDKTTQEVKLSNRVDLIFNLSGTFLRLDD